MINVYTNEDFMDYTHVFSSMGMPKDTSAHAGAQSVKARLVAELNSFNFSNVISGINDYTSIEEKAFVDAMYHKKIYITIHHLGKTLKPFSMRPALNITDYIDNGKPAEHHIQIIGKPNSGKTLLANMARKVLSALCPTTEVIIVDTDSPTFNFYYGNDTEREMFLTNIRHQKINIGVPMLQNR